VLALARKGGGGGAASAAMTPLLLLPLSPMAPEGTNRDTLVGGGRQLSSMPGTRARRDSSRIRAVSVRWILRATSCSFSSDRVYMWFRKRVVEVMNSFTTTRVRLMGMGGEREVSIVLKMTHFSTTTEKKMRVWPVWGRSDIVQVT
jgi:hypothetical protein